MPFLELASGGIPLLYKPFEKEFTSNLVRGGHKSCLITDLSHRLPSRGPLLIFQNLHPIIGDI